MNLRAFPMNKFRVVLIVFVIYASSINGQETCPTGIPSIQDCRLNSCELGSICYRKGDARICCGALDKFCLTKLHTFNSKVGSSYSWAPGASTMKEKWYDVKKGSEMIACPIPFSFAYSLFKELKVLPIDFDESKPESSEPKACNLNSHCKTDNDEFCGVATNPAFPDELDGSGKDGTPLRFCYKFQNFGSTNVKPVITADKTELTGCDNNSDCSPYKGTETFCLVKETEVRIAENNGVVVVQGFCAFEQTRSALWWYVLAGSIVSTVIWLGLSITFYILHRKREKNPYGPYGIYDPDAPRVLTTEDIIKQNIKHLAEWEEEQRRNGKKKPAVTTEQYLAYNRRLAAEDEEYNRKQKAERQRKLEKGLIKSPPDVSFV